MNASVATVATPSLDPLVDQLVDALDGIEGRGNEGTWASARTYLEGYEALSKAPPYQGLHGHRLMRVINSDLRASADRRGKTIPRVSFLSNSHKVLNTWKDLFSVDTNILPYDHYRQIAVCSLPRSRRELLRQWAERHQPNQIGLRARIRQQVDAYNRIHKPDFELKVSNCWKFSSSDDQVDFGAVHSLIYANLLYWFTEPGDAALDPMAGTGTLGKVLARYRYFTDGHPAEGSGKRTALMSDIEPTGADIQCVDAYGPLPFSGVALAIVDPPYLRIADEKDYRGLGATLEEWLAALERIITNILPCLVAGGALAVMSDDVLRDGEHVPIAYLITGMLVRLGFTPRATIYNTNPTFVWTMGPAAMRSARLAKMQLNGCKIIQVATK